MEFIQYVKWTEPGEKDKFLSLAKQYQDKDVLIDILIKEFGIDKYQALILLSRFKGKINEVRNQK